MNRIVDYLTVHLFSMACAHRKNVFSRGKLCPQLRLPPRLTQTVKTLFAVRSKELDRQGNVIAYSEPVGEAEAGHAGEQTAKE
jgi:hypothetical protein